jgi:hypothetical protein
MASIDLIAVFLWETPQMNLFSPSFFTFRSEFD